MIASTDRRRWLTSCVEKLGARSRSSLSYIVRFVAAFSLLIVAISASPSRPSFNVSAKSCGTCPDVCLEAECSCNDFDCGSAEFCNIEGPSDFCAYATGCPPGEVYYNGCCATLGSPILLDLAHNGFDLTNLASGVVFPIGSGSQPYQLSWTEPQSDDAWLVLDRNGNGRIDSGGELFGNNTPQPQPPQGKERNGYRALAVYDSPEQGGNADRQITPADKVYQALRLWQDWNHNGVSEERELRTLETAGVVALSLDYRKSERHDRYGNIFRYRSKIDGASGTSFNHGGWSTDVFLVIGRPST